MNNHENDPNIRPGTSTEELKAQDDALFETLSRSKRQKKRKLLRTALILILVLAVVLATGVSILRHRVREQFASGGAEVLSETVRTGTISTLVSGNGILTNVDAQAVTIPEGVELTEILVKNGEIVEEGQLLAVADLSSVRSALAAIQEEIEALDDQLYDADGDEASTRVAAGVPGRVKIIYGNAGDNVADVMVENGALAVLSLDGYMMLQLETDALSEGDAVTVRRSDGSELGGIVESLIKGTATILVTDDGPENGETVTVRSEDGTELGSGELAVHSPLMITGYAGTIRTVHARLNARVSKNTYLFTLKDTAFSAAYDTLLRDRSEAEKILLELLNIQKHGGITAPVSGSIFSAVSLEDLEADDTITELLTLSPDVSMSVTISVDESDILSLELDQQASVTVSSITDETLTGTVTEIDKTASDGAYTAVVTLDKIDGMLPGMSASVDVKIQGVENALLVSADAVHYTSTGAYVYTSYNEETEEYGGRVDIVTGLSNDDSVEVISGLKEGDTVYYTEKEEFFGFGNMGGMGYMPGNMGNMPGSMGNMDGGSRNNRPGGMPGENGMPGGMPGRG